MKISEAESNKIKSFFTKRYGEGTRKYILRNVSSIEREFEEGEEAYYVYLKYPKVSVKLTALTVKNVLNKGPLCQI